VSLTDIQQPGTSPGICQHFLYPVSYNFSRNTGKKYIVHQSSTSQPFSTNQIPFLWQVVYAKFVSNEEKDGYIRTCLDPPRFFFYKNYFISITSKNWAGLVPLYVNTSRRMEPTLMQEGFIPTSPISFEQALSKPVPPSLGGGHTPTKASPESSCTVFVASA
jgi:hypothetical protein